jgi:hypothetical protein
MIIGEAFIREKQSLICLKNPDNTCVCGHYEPLNKRWFLGGSKVLIALAGIGLHVAVKIVDVLEAIKNRDRNFYHDRTHFDRHGPDTGLGPAGSG